MLTEETHNDKDKQHFGALYKPLKYSVQSSGPRTLFFARKKAPRNTSESNSSHRGPKQQGLKVPSPEISRKFWESLKNQQCDDSKTEFNAETELEEGVDETDLSEAQSEQSVNPILCQPRMSTYALYNISGNNSKVTLQTESHTAEYMPTEETALLTHWEKEPSNEIANLTNPLNETKENSIKPPESQQDLVNYDSEDEPSLIQSPPLKIVITAIPKGTRKTLLTKDPKILQQTAHRNQTESVWAPTNTQPVKQRPRLLTNSNSLASAAGSRLIRNRHLHCANYQGFAAAKYEADRKSTETRKSQISLGKGSFVELSYKFGRPFSFSRGPALRSTSIFRTLKPVRPLLKKLLI